MKRTISQRMLCALLSIVMLLAYLPAGILTATAVTADAYATVADPETLTRPETIYGDSTVNAGKITVGKSVSDEDITVNGENITIDGENNFLVTISQFAQVMGLTSQINVPLDVVIVFDTSGSMGNDSNKNGKNRTQELVEAANKMIASLMDMNELNRVGVVAFSAHNAGGGTAGYNAANVLSELAHYDGEAATKHLKWATGNGPSWAPTVQLVRGRSTTNGVTNSRYGTGGATNIQAGVTLGAQLLMEADTTIQVGEQEITRTPIMILMSDGAPTVSAYENQWWNASQTNNQGPTNAPFMGNGFLTVLTASYFKNQITRHYYGTNAGENACSIYTVGVELSDAATQSTVEEVDLSYMTLNPKGEFVEGSDNYYYDRNNAADSFLDAWTSYRNGQEFSVRVWSGQTRHDGYYYFYNRSHTLQNANDYKNGADTWTTVGRTTVGANILDSVTTLHYNDKFYDVTNVSQLTDALDEMLTEIARKAITVPTKVTTGDHNFDGYVNFYDPIGEYMEVKDMKGVLAGGYHYRGASFAKYLQAYGTENANRTFDGELRSVIKTRMNLSAASSKFESEEALDKFIDELLIAARDSANQANYTDNENFDNSFVWWGNAYNSGEEDEHVQLVGFADNDTIDYITDPTTQIPADADYVCRSYFFYGEAGGANPNPDHQYLYFVVRVQRELTAPYRQTVVISAPASLLSMEKVLVEESYDESGNRVYTATVEHQEPARVVYEVGLWDSINSENVSYIVSEEYATETVNGVGSVNYDADTDTYQFFTNDWDRSQSMESHHRGMAKATFDAAADNAFYTYQEDTLLVNARGEAVTSNPAGSSVYYVRSYYEWPADGKQDGTYAATKKTVLIPVEIPEGAQLLRKDGKWYIPAGTYTAATLVVNGDDTMKDDPATAAVNDGNFTGTSSIVAHPHRTGDANNSHYTVYLGNNGKLSLQAEPYTPVKTVSVNLPDTAVNIVDDEGKAVKVGDVLTYTVEIKNVLPVSADITVTDYIPQGTAFVSGSAGDAIVPDSNNVLTWVLENVPAGQTRYVSFQVTVTEAALSLNVVPNTIDNTAKVNIGNRAIIDTNTTHNPPYGKTVTDVNNRNIDGEHGFKVGDTLVYHIRFHNNAMNANGEYIAADVTVTDKIPEGTSFLSADNGGSYNAATNTVTWSFADMPADTAKTVSFRVKINASAKAQSGQSNGIEPATGEIYLPNTAVIVVENEPVITLTTNTTENWADLGDMVLTKLVAEGGDRGKTFTINLTESTGMLSGKYPVNGGDGSYVEFQNGKGSVSIKHGQTLTIQGLPAGVIITVEEDLSALPGWTPTYNTQSVAIVKGAATTVSSVSVTNTYTLQPLTVTVKGEKNMRDALPVQTTFGFVAEPDSSNPVVGDALTGEVTVKAAGVYTFTLSPKTFTQPGVYKYTISEIVGGTEGIGYDGTKYTLVINVIDNGDGTMGATATLDGNAFDLQEDAVSFTNTYIPEDIPLTVVANKTLKIYDAATDAYVDAELTAGQFRFQIVEKESGEVVTTGTNAADGTIRFNTFYFSADMLQGVNSKVFTFVVSEVIPELAKDPNMSYDRNGYEFEATLTYANGNLTVTVDGDSDGNVDITDTVNFVNYSNPDSVEIRPEGTKTTADAPSGVSFSFSVINTETGNEAAAGVGDANGDISFSAMRYTQPGTYTYWIQESNAGNVTNGITYDATRYLMKVVVSRNAHNRLVAEVTYLASAVDGSDDVADYTAAVAAPAFHNEYNAGGYINLTATKNLSGRELNAGEFAFKLVRQDNGGEIDGIVDANGKITFSTMYYSEDDIPDGESSAVIYYVMSEIIPTNAALPGVTYDTSSYDVYVRITDNGNGTISTELVKPDGNGGYTAMSGTDTGITFRNTYTTVNGDEITFRIRKTLNGRTLREGEFDFLLYRAGNLVDIATNAADGTVTFTRQIPATTAPGIYEMEIREAFGSLAGVTYDTASYKVYVRITDDGSGNIVAQLVDSEGNPLAEDGNGVVDLTDEIVFVNTYVPHGVAVELEATKTLTGRKLQDKEFSFTVRQDNVNGKIVATGSNDTLGKILFSSFEITSQDMGGQTQKTFTYVVTESDNNVPGVTVDSTVFTVTVTVTDDGNGVLKADIHYPDDKAIVFENTYIPAPATLPLVAFKTLNGMNLAADAFTFQLKDADGEVVRSATNDGNGVITFEALHFDKVGTYVYTLTEKAETRAGMVYDGNVYTVTVTVTDDGNGQLTANAAYTDSEGKVELIRFVNSYTPPVLDVTLEGNKTIVDANNNPLNHNPAGFTFVVRDVDGKHVSTAVSDENGDILFEGFQFSAAGEYRFLISEQATARPGYFVDTTVWCVHITIGYNADSGKLFHVGTYVHPAPESHDVATVQTGNAINFVNTYRPDGVSLTLKVLKKLDGRTLRDHEFTFYAMDTVTGLRVAEARNHANGEVNLRLSYTKAGTYTYVICEEIPADGEKLGGVTYTTKTHTVTVIVTDDGSGKLQAQIDDIIALDTETVDLTETVIFQNTYTTTPANVTIEAWKRLEGKALDANSFTFTLVNKKDATDKYTATNDGEGKVAFPTITYQEAGVYEYTLTEAAGTAKGITYDNRVYTVVVTVTDDGNGALHAVTHYTNSDGGMEAIPVFHNIYKAAPVDYTPKVKKIYEGDIMRTFDFLLSGEGFPAQTKQNDANGDVVFDTLTFTNPGSYTFTISEQTDDALDFVKWDTNVYQLTIDVTDDGNGQLAIEDISIISENGRNDLVFRNVHEDLITDKDVFLNNDLSVSIDGKTVEKGDILTYTLSYTNYTGKTANVTITDTIPQYTSYVADSADMGGTYADGVLTWVLTDVAPDATVTVSFNVAVIATNVVVENKATVLEGTNSYETNVVTNPVEEDTVIKDVFHVNEPTISIDGETVQKGDILLYKVTYTNSDDFPADVTITDTIPQYTSYVANSADMGGIYADGVLTWQVSLAAGESVTVSFQVEVLETNITVVNQAIALEGENELETNIVTNPVPEDKVVKDVFHVNEPTISIDGETVQKGDILLYKVTYTNSYEAAADVTITDTIPQYTSYVANSADMGGIYADGVLTWQVSLAAGESVTVSFQVEVLETNITVVNQAIALEGENELETNIVTNPVPNSVPPYEPVPETGEHNHIAVLVGILSLSATMMLAVLILSKKEEHFER